MAIGGIHGNEIVGIQIVKWLESTLANTEQSTFDQMSGDLIIGLGNPKAINVGQRATSSKEDLNRCFLMKNNFEDNIQNEKHFSYEKKRSLQIRPILEETDILLDLHATNKPSPPFIRIAGETFSKEHERVVSYFSNVNILLRDIHYTIGNGVISTTDEFVQNNNGIGICYEVGQADDLECLNIVKNEVRCFLKSELNLIIPDDDANNVQFEPLSFDNLETYEMVEPINLAPGHSFEWAKQPTRNDYGGGDMNTAMETDGISDAYVGDKNFEYISANQDIGYMLSMDNNSTTTISCPFDSYLVFPKVNYLMIEGKPLVWLCKKMP